jgi:hypothetical protein
MGGHAAGVRKIDTFGFNSADSGGVSLDPGATANTKPGTWTDIGGVTPSALRAIGISIGGQANTARATGNSHWRIDVGYGATPKIVIRDAWTWTEATLDNIMFPYYGCVPMYVPAGVQLKARCQSNVTDATDRLIDVVLHGVRA